MSPSDFLQSDLFQKNSKKNKSGIPSVSNSLDPDQVQCVLGAVSINVKPDLDPKLFWLTLTGEELTGFFIFGAFYLL